MMKGLFTFLAAAALLAVTGCASGPENRPPNTVQGTSMHEKTVRDEFWQKHYMEREKKARERMEKPSETGITE